MKQTIVFLVVVQASHIFGRYYFEEPTLRTPFDRPTDSVEENVAINSARRENLFPKSRYRYPPFKRILILKPLAPTPKDVPDIFNGKKLSQFDPSRKNVDLDFFLNYSSFLKLPEISSRPPFYKFPNDLDKETTTSSYINSAPDNKKLENNVQLLLNELKISKDFEKATNKKFQDIKKVVTNLLKFLWPLLEKLYGSNFFESKTVDPPKINIDVLRILFEPLLKKFFEIKLPNENNKSSDKNIFDKNEEMALDRNKKDIIQLLLQNFLAVLEKLYGIKVLDDNKNGLDRCTKELVYPLLGQFLPYIGNNNTTYKKEQLNKEILLVLDIINKKKHQNNNSEFYLEKKNIQESSRKEMITFLLRYFLMIFEKFFGIQVPHTEYNLDNCVNNVLKPILDHIFREHEWRRKEGTELSPDREHEEETTSPQTFLSHTATATTTADAILSSSASTLTSTSTGTNTSTTTHSSEEVNSTIPTSNSTTEAVISTSPFTLVNTTKTTSSLTTVTNTTTDIPTPNLTTKTVINSTSTTTTPLSNSTTKTVINVTPSITSNTTINTTTFFSIGDSINTISTPSSSNQPSPPTNSTKINEAFPTTNTSFSNMTVQELVTTPPKEYERRNNTNIIAEETKHKNIVEEATPTTIASFSNMTTEQTVTTPSKANDRNINAKSKENKQRNDLEARKMFDEPEEEKHAMGFKKLSNKKSIHKKAKDKNLMVVRKLVVPKVNNDNDFIN